MPLSEEVLRTWRIVILLRKSWSEPTQFILHSPYFLIQSIVLPILPLLVYVRCYKIDNRNDRIKETRQENPKQSLYPTIWQPHTFIPWHHIRHIIEMASESNHQLSQAGLTIGNERIVRWCNVTDLQSIRNESRFWIGSLFFPKLADCLPTFVSFLSLVVLSLYRKLNAW